MQNVNRIAFISAAACAAVALTSVAADEIIIESAKDNTLYEDTDGMLSNGAGERIFVGRTGDGSIRRALLAFDVAAAVPAGSTINSVSLRMNMSRTIAGDHDVSLHTLTADWGEGASDALGAEGRGIQAEEGDATWIHTFYDDMFWTTEGGDFNASPRATTTVGPVDRYTWTSTLMAADVQAWLDDANTNFGWIAIGDESIETTAKRFDSREIGNAQNRPRLTIDFTPPVGGPATLTGFTYRFGSFVEGGLAELAASDDTYLRSASQFGFLSSEPNVLEIIFAFDAPAGTFTLLDVTLENRANNPLGRGSIKLRNWNTNGLETVGTFDVPTVDDTFTFDDVDATDHIRSSDQRIDLGMKHVIVATFSTSGFQSRVDFVEIVVE